MNKHSNLANSIWCIILTVILLLFMILSINSLLPLKWQFPAWKLSSHLETKKENTAEGTRIDFVNRHGKTTVALDKNYATVVQTLDQYGNCILEQYFDSHGKPATLLAGYSAIRREFNEDRKWICTTYLDDELSPTVIPAGYSTIHRTYNANGEVETETYYDSDGLPTPDIYNKYGIRYEYNENGYKSTVISLDVDGKKMFVLRFFLRNSILTVLLIGVLLLLLILLSGRAPTWILLLLYLIFIAYMTIINRETANNATTWVLPPNYYLFFANTEILSNIWLFIPLGAILYKLSHMWEIIAFPIMLTLMIETSQFLLDIGVFQLSDLIANSIGGIIGIAIIYLLSAGSTI